MFYELYNWSELEASPTLIMTIALHMNNGIYHLPCVCLTLVLKIHVHPEMLCVFRYIDVFTCMIV